MSNEKTNSDIVANTEVNVKLSSRKKRITELLSKANTLPQTPGCYLMKNSLGAIIYVGKAKKLKARVSSYFNNSSKSAKTSILVSHVVSFDFILTNSEAESLVLENNLIKEHRPKYNIRLKDDKTYPYISVNYARDFPKLEYIRRPRRQKKIELFGPYPVGSNILNIMRIIMKAFKIRDCSEHEFNSRKTPCMLYQIKQCSAPCVNLISKKDYKKDVEAALNFLRDEKNFKKSLDLLTKQMMDAAESESFEQATILRDYIFQLEEFGKKSFEQNVEMLSDKNTDVIAYYIGEEEVDISIYLIRNGNLLGHKNFHFLKSDIFHEIEDDILGLIVQYYASQVDALPLKIVTNLSKDNSEVLEGAIQNLLEDQQKVIIRSGGKKYDGLLKATLDHARESGRVRADSADSVYQGLNRLKDLLKLKDRPKTLECYDIAIWQGKSPTAAKIVFYEGKPDKKEYRHYNLAERPEGNNDFAMMEEVFGRRLKKGNLPDVFIVDGGVGQVNSAKKILAEFEIDRPVIGIAKARDLMQGNFMAKEAKSSDERLVIPNRMNPYILSKCPPLMKIVVSMRDEAHRFSRRLHHKKEHERVMTSWVDDIKGISASSRDKILKINTMEKSQLRLMKTKELQDFFGISSKHASALSKYLHDKS